MAFLFQYFRDLWETEYLTSLREFHRTTGSNKQTINIGDVALVKRWANTSCSHSHVKWKNEPTNCEITIYPLKVRATCEENHPIEIEQLVMQNDNSPENRTERLVRAAARKTSQQISNWAKVLKCTLRGCRELRFQ